VDHYKVVFLPPDGVQWQFAILPHTTDPSSPQPLIPPPTFCTSRYMWQIIRPQRNVVYRSWQMLQRDETFDHQKHTCHTVKQDHPRDDKPVYQHLSQLDDNFQWPDYHFGEPVRPIEVCHRFTDPRPVLSRESPFVATPIRGGVLPREEEQGQDTSRCNCGTRHTPKDLLVLPGKRGVPGETVQSSVGKSGDGEPQAKPFVLEDGIQSWKVVQAVGQVADATVGKLLGFELSHYEELPLSLVQQSANIRKRNGAMDLHAGSRLRGYQPSYHFLTDASSRGTWIVGLQRPPEERLRILPSGGYANDTPKARGANRLFCFRQAVVENFLSRWKTGPGQQNDNT